MAFTIGDLTPAAIGRMVVTLVTDPILNENGAYFKIDVLDDENQLIKRPAGNLIPHLTAQQISQLQTFMTNLRTQAETEILP